MRRCVRLWAIQEVRELGWPMPCMLAAFLSISGEEVCVQGAYKTCGINVWNWPALCVRAACLHGVCVRVCLRARVCRGTHVLTRSSDLYVLPCTGTNQTQEQAALAKNG
eukprot:scaffold16012_cov18-Tisochrysis_lutea.AAC.1